MNLYLLKANICLSIFVMIYGLFLRNNTFYKLNRLYFLLVILISIILPLLNLSDFVNQHDEITKNEIVQQLPDLSLSSQNQEVTESSAQNFIPENPIILINFQDIFEAIFISGMLILLCKLVVQIISVFSILKRSNRININGINIQNLKENISPFSFFNLIFINTNQHSESDLAEIIAHEHIHAKQGHSFDVVLTELFCATFWINPFAWILRKFMKQNLEFLTDKTVLQSGFDVKNYQYNLLKINGLNISPITNSFNLSDLKMRIKMMNRKRSSNLHLVKYFFIIPIGAVIILAFNISKAKSFDAQKGMFQNLKETVKAVEFGESFSEEQISKIDKNILTKNAEIVLESNDNQLITSKPDSTNKAWNLNTADIRIVDKETRQGVKGIKIFDDKGKLLATTNFQGICFFDYPKPFKEIVHDSLRIEGRAFKVADSFHKIILLSDNLQKAEFVFKGFQKSTHMTVCNGIFEIKFSMKLDTFSFKMTEEEKKSKNWTKTFNDKFKERPLTTLRSDGSVWIEPKTKWFYCKEDIIKELKQTQESSIEKRPVYMVNGKVVANDFKFEELSIHSLVSLSYWKPEDGELMKAKYGDQARNGIYDLMVLEKSKVAVNSQNNTFEPSTRDLPKVERCTPSVDFPANALYIIDGKEVDSGYLHKNVKPEEIENLTVMDKEIARTKYGDKGKKGVILISTKKLINYIKIIPNPKNYIESMKKLSTLLSFALLIFLSSCTDTKQITDLQDQARRLEAQITKERQENAELSSYRFSMESQFKRKNEDYVKCQEEGKDNFESLSKRYGELNSDYDKLGSAYKSLNEANDANREMSARVIVDLEERIKQMRTSGGDDVAAADRVVRPVKVVRKKRARKR